jgi:hypothetical protein
VKGRGEREGERDREKRGDNNTWKNQKERLRI